MREIIFLQLLFLLFWFIAQVKTGLFWFYLWQLKECHFKRFIDHFRTEKGRRIFFSPLLLFKALFLLVFLFYFLFLPAQTIYYDIKIEGPSLGEYLLIFSTFAFLGLYFFEGLSTIRKFFRKIILKPLFTKKIIILFSAFLLLQLFYLVLTLFFKVPFGQHPFRLVMLLLLFDLTNPIAVSLLISSFYPLTLLYQYSLFKKALKKRETMKNLIVIGITGSYGKTSTKEFLAKILSEKYKVLKTEKHINAEVGIAKTILEKLKPEHQILIAEIGAYNRGKIREVCQFLQPQIGILTGINEQHMATFGSQENIIKGKFELIESLPEEGIAVMNNDNEFINLKLKAKSGKLHPPKFYSKIWEGKQLKTKNLRFYSVREKADIWAEDIRVKKDFITFKVLSRDGDMAFFKVNLIGAHNVSNILAVTLVAHERFGFSLAEIAKICQEFKPEMGAMILKKGAGDLNIIESTYSANPDGVISALDYLKVWRSPEGKPLASYGVNKKVIVMPCLIELGKASKEVHRKIGQKIAETCDLAIITTKDSFKEIKEGAIEKGMPKESILFIENPKEMVKKIKEFCHLGDVVLLEGRVPKELAQKLIP